MHLYDTAIFYGERLVVACPSEANKHLLASALGFSGQWRAARVLLKGATSPPNLYLSARAALAVGAVEEVEGILLSGPGLGPLPVDEKMAALQKDPYRVPGGAAGAALLGTAAQAQEKHQLASHPASSSNDLIRR